MAFHHTHNMRQDRIKPEVIISLRDGKLKTETETRTLGVALHRKAASEHTLLHRSPEITQAHQEDCMSHIPHLTQKEVGACGPTTQRSFG